MSFKIQSKIISRRFKPFIIAEMSGNHGKSFEKAMKIVELAADSGADAIKLQTYTPDTMTLDINENDFVINDKDNLWYGKSLYELYAEAFTPWEWHKPIMEYANKLGLLCFSTPFDNTSVDFLEELDVPAYKIASFENLHFPLLRKVASTGKPMIISMGMSTFDEITQIIEYIKDSGCNNYAILKCTSSYPAAPQESNVSTIADMREKFDCEVGLSDHTPGIGVAVASIVYGASIIEKHFTLDKADGAVDSTFSLDPNEFRLLVKETKIAWEAKGKINYGPTESEHGSLKRRRSIYVSETIKKGEHFNSSNLKIIRPGFGLAPKYYDQILGKTVKKDLEKGTPVSWEMFE
ncbi:MAG: pseudaminic acid synthase [Candidatus Marinimicrobia bacterium]|nr:pseudaminic acid synthase [Candidatus Neomarinimicrobiota bacterium]